MKRLLNLFLLLCLFLTACSTKEPPVNNGNESETESTGDTAEESIKETNKEPTMGNPLYSERWRPSYHFTSKNSWINDPNGLTYFKGLYHIYYQLNPGTPQHGNIHWGHATSEDLVHFTEHKPVLAPDESGDMWSGTTYVDAENRSGLFDGVEGGGLIAAYSTSTQKIGLAYSADGFTFKKIGIVIDNRTIDAFRDPKLFFDDISGKWTMVVAGGQVRFYQSEDLKSWTLVSENTIYTECPDFFPLKVEGSKKTMWVLTCGGRHAFVGDWDGTTFTPKSGQIPLNYGPDSYAGIIFSADRENRTLMLSWMNNWAYTQPADGIWAGANTLVHELTLVKKGAKYRILQKPVKEYEILCRDVVVDLKNYIYQNENPFTAVDSQSYRLKLQVDLSQNKDFTLSFYNGDEDVVTLFCDASAKKITVDRSKSVMGIDAMKKKSNATYSFQLEEKYDNDEILDLEIYVDTSSLEVYALGYSHVLSLRTQPMTSSRGLSLKADEGLVLLSANVTTFGNIHFENEDEVDAVYLEKKSVKVKAEDPTGAFVRVATFGGKPFVAESMDDTIAEVSVVEGGIVVTGKKRGYTYIKITAGSTYVKLAVQVAKNDSASS